MGARPGAVGAWERPWGHDRGPWRHGQGSGGAAMVCSVATKTVEGRPGVVVVHQCRGDTARGCGGAAMVRGVVAKVVGARSGAVGRGRGCVGAATGRWGVAKAVGYGQGPWRRGQRCGGAARGETKTVGAWPRPWGHPQVP